MNLQHNKQKTEKKGRRPALRADGKMWRVYIEGLANPDYRERLKGNERLLKGLKGKDREAMRAAVLALQHPDLRGVADWEKPSVRINSAYVLTQAAKKEVDILPAVPALLERTCDRDEQVGRHSQFALAAALESKVGEEVLAALTRKLETAPVAKQKNLLRALGDGCENERVTEMAVPLLPKLSQRLSEPRFRSGLFECCGKLMERGLTHSDTAVRATVSTAYADHLKNGGDVQQGLRSLLAAGTDEAADAALEVARSSRDDSLKRKLVVEGLRSSLPSLAGQSARRSVFDAVTSMVSLLESVIKTQSQPPPPKPKS